jgi:hypothetical protein
MTDRTDERLRSLYAAAAADSPDTPHPDPERLAEAARGRGSETSRLAVLDHAMTCAQCRRDLDLVRSAVRAGQRLQRDQLVTRSLLAVAAVVVVAVTLSFAGRGSLAHFWRPPTADTERGGNDSESTAVELVAPLGPVPPNATPALVWRRVPGATSYLVEIIHDGGLAVLRTATPDTSLAWPSLPRGQSYRWRVSATSPDGIVRRSAFSDLPVAGP